MKVLVACEFSGRVRDAFTRAGHYAMSCDLLPSETVGNHYIGDIFDMLMFDWDLVIAHPPCTYIAVSGNAHYANSPKRLEAVAFVEKIWKAYGRHSLAIENPVGVLPTMSCLGPATQYIQPYEFGHPESKKTGLWLRGLPKLKPTFLLRLAEGERWSNQTPSGQNNLGPSADRWKIRSRTYEGIAEAMADQWGHL